MKDYIVKGLDKLDEKNIDILFPVGRDVSVKESISHGALLYKPNNRMKNIQNKRFSFIATSQLIYAQDTTIPCFLEQQSDDVRERNRAIEVKEFINFPEYSQFNRELEKIWGENSLQYMKSTLNARLIEHWDNDEDDVLINPMRDFLEVIWKDVS